MAVERTKDKKIVVLEGREAARYLHLSNYSPPEDDYTDYYASRAEELLTDRKPDDLWETAYDGTVTAENLPWDTDAWVIFRTFVNIPKLKGVRRDFQKLHRMRYRGDPPPPYSDDRETPVEVSVAEAELAHGIIEDYVWRLAPKKSRRLSLLLWHMKSLRKATLRAFPAYADALETAATEHRASNAEAGGRSLHSLPNRVVKAMAECMTDMERNFAAMGVFACIEARVEKLHDMETVFDWSFQNRSGTDDREPVHPAPAYARTLGSRSFRRKMEVVLGRGITWAVISAYDDAISARRLRARVATACREHGAALPELAEDMAAVVENHLYFKSTGLHHPPKYRKMDKHEMFRQAVEDAVASVLCQEEIVPPNRGGCLDLRKLPSGDPAAGQITHRIGAC